MAYIVCAISFGQTTRYVDVESTNATAPYLSWEEAATSIQAALDVGEDGDTILVSNGVYGVGQSLTPGGALFNRVVITNGVTLRSVNGPSSTAIAGGG